MNLYKVTVPYGRGEMTARYLVVAMSVIKAKRLADAAAPVPTPLHSIKVEQLLDLRVAELMREPTVIAHL